MAVKKTKSTAKKSGGDKEKYLVVVESPAKSKTINKILGKNFKVIASMGHIVDLPADRMGIDFEHDFTPEYQVMKGRAKYMKDIKKEAKEAKTVFLAADPDREGEAICWHLKNQLESCCSEFFRVRFEEITERAVKEAFEKKGEIDMNKVNAQQARRVFDRIVGYSLSPLLWGKITRGLSAGRVQSVAVRLIVEREEEIKKFKPEEYWSLDAILRKVAGKVDKGISDFRAKLIKFKGEKVHIGTKITSDQMMSGLSGAKFIVADVGRKEKKSYPRSPYTTSVMQQDAFNKLNFSASKTMRIAQKLYEGVDLGEAGTVGLITYMRTDSVRISDDAMKELQKFILDKYGAKYAPPVPFVYKAKKSAQEAHEAIRPALPLREPNSLAAYLTPDEMKLYTLIWKRFVSSQMQTAVYSVLTVHINAGEYTFRAGGSDLIFDGFLRVYKEYGALDEEEVPPEMPPLETGEEVKLVELIPEQHFTKPPARYSDASLVKVLEEKGIGRPSTYAPIIRTIIDRNYVKRVNRYFQPTELGQLVNDLLVKNFPDIVDYDFTAKLEGELDDIEEGKMNWVKAVKEFYEPFTGKLAEAKEKMKNVNKQEVKTDQVCEKCGRPMIIKWGKKGRFLSCSGFPECRNAKSISTGVKCPAEGCGGELVERRSFRGSFYGCTNYPKCTYTSRTLNQPGQAAEGAADGAAEAKVEDE
ncbi:MAG TPA: type I DNA topoisomerase [Candidatus Omnitrophota bacterium]|nr:type I DNA topoisomerase [Candidatus Omnitrophota bacterium]HPS19829.1 type I DNA topoisomerase [Candidatus Omnitrophota bacterium]